MNRNKFLCILGVLALLAMPLFGSGGGAAATTEKPTVSLYGNFWDRNPDWSMETFVIKEFAEIMDANIELISGDHQKFTTLVASGNVPDLMKGTIESVNESHDLGQKGILFPLDTKFDKMPVITSLRKMRPEYDAVMAADDGHHYATPETTGYPMFTPGPAVSPAMKEVGIDPKNDLKTFDDLYDAFRKLKQQWPENYPWVTRRGMKSYRWQMFGTSDSIWINPLNEKAEFAPMEEQYRLAVEYMAKCWADGLMHPEFFTMDEDPWRELLTTGKAYFTVDAFKQAPWHGGADDINAAPETWWITILAPEFNGKKYWSSFQSPYISSGIVWAMGAKTEEADRCVKLIDYLYSDDGVMLIYYGREGETYEIQDHGFAKYIYPPDVDDGNPKHNSSDAETALMWARGFHFFRGAVYAENYQFNPEFFQPAYELEQRKMYLDNDSVQPPQPVLAFTPDEWDQVKQIKVDAETVRDEWIVQFVRGIKPLSAWNDYVAQLKKVGVDEWTKIYDAAYARYKAKMK